MNLRCAESALRKWLTRAGIIQRAAPIFALLVFLCGTVHAQPVEYTQIATATGSLGGVVFTDKLITITLRADISDVRGGATFFFVPGTATVDVSDVGTAMFTGVINAFVNQAPFPAGTPAWVGIYDATVQSFVVLATETQAFASYDLRGPIGAISGTAVFNSGLEFETNVGSFVLTTIAGGMSTFTASWEGTPPPPTQPPSPRRCGQPFSSFRQASALACLSTSSGSCDIDGEAAVVPSGAAQIGGTFGSSMAQLTASVAANSSYGALSSGASQNFSIQEGTAYAYGTATGDFQDIITVHLGSFTGSGILLVQYTVGGNILDFGAARSFADVDVEVCGPGIPTQSESRIHSSSVAYRAFQVERQFRFIYGVPHALHFRLGASSGTFDGTFRLARRSGTGTGQADFLNTLVVSGLQVFDEFMNPMSGATFSSASGTPYTENGVGMLVPIEVRPGGNGAPINLNSQGTIPVAILSDSALIAPVSIDPFSLTFGSTGLERSLARCNWSGEDVNGDNLLDLVCHFNARLAAFDKSSTVAILRGRTLGGVPIQGRDSIRIVP